MFGADRMVTFPFRAFMSRIQREANLDRMCKELQDYSLTQVPPPADQIPGLARRLSESIFLANSSTPDNFARICSAECAIPGAAGPRGGFIASQKFLSVMNGVPVNPLKCEAAMGTSGDVFFYLAPFRYPRTACGLLFSTTLENGHRDDGVGTPFDSGGLHRHLTRTNPSESARTFLERHELPIPQHRQYLAYSLQFLFGSPEDYIEGNEPLNPGPLGLAEGDTRGRPPDPRRWTHEVRLPDRVFVRTGHLQAVFAPSYLVKARRPIRDLFKWCDNEGVDTITFGHPSGEDCSELRRQCLEYMRKSYTKAGYGSNPRRAT
jgi:hypothetical protein